MSLGTFEKRASPTGQGDREIRDELQSIVYDFENSRERTMQKSIGLSEIGHACSRRIAYKLSGFPEPADTSDPWLAIIGTATHDWLAKALTWKNAQLGWDRYLIEHTVSLRDGLNGHCDVYDQEKYLVVDHKIVGKTMYDKYRIQGPLPEYKVQAHSYGQGWVNKGYRVDKVAIALFPRFIFLNQAFFVWSEAFDPGVVTKALARLDTIESLIRALNPAADPVQFTKFPRFPERNCLYCPFFKPGEDTGATCPGNT